MSRVITFSRVFPSHHSKKGQPTHFVEAILTQLSIDYRDRSYLKWLYDNNPGITESFLDDFFSSLVVDTIYPKSHTIRAHKYPLKVSDWISFKCWAGKPYNKTEQGFWQIKFAPDIQVKKTWNFRFDSDGCIYLNNDLYAYPNSEFAIRPMSLNDGLDRVDFINWFCGGVKKKKIFKGHIICWNESINYQSNL